MVMSGVRIRSLLTECECYQLSHLWLGCNNQVKLYQEWHDTKFDEDSDEITRKFAEVQTTKKKKKHEVALLH